MKESTHTHEFSTGHNNCLVDGCYRLAPSNHVSPRQAIINTVPEEDRAIVGLSVSRYSNSTADAGRPSDAARSVVREYNANPERFRQRFEEIRKLERS